jgi:predicted aspartyl protease
VGETVQSNRTIILCVCALLTASSFGSGVENNNFNSRKISFKLYEEYLIVVQGSLGDLKKRNLLVDTGTNPTIIDQSIAKQLQLASITGTPDTLPVITGDVSAKWSVLPAVQVGPVHRESIRVVIEDLSPFTKMVGTRIDALVGLDVLGQSSFRIDYSHKQIVFGPVELTGPSIRFSSEPPFVTVPMSIGKRQLNVLLDTGTSGLVLFARRLGTWPRGLAQVGLATSAGLAGPTYLPVAQVNNAKIGDHDVGVREVYLSNRPQCCSFDGLMGITSTRMKQIGFDFEHGVFSWQLQSDAIPTMSEARADSCLPASSPGLMPRSEASAEMRTSDLSGCGVVPVPYAMYPQQRR